MTNDLIIAITTSGMIIGKERDGKEKEGRGFWLKAPRFIRDVQTPQGPALGCGKMAGLPDMVFIPASCPYFVCEDKNLSDTYIQATTGLTLATSNLRN